MFSELQERVVQWVRKCFGDEAVRDRQLRALRLVEEAAEFAQAVGVERHTLCDVLALTYTRPAGDPAKELGGVMVTALAAAESVGAWLGEEADREVERIEAMPAEHFQHRNREKIQPATGDGNRWSEFNLLDMAGDFLLASALSEDDFDADRAMEIADAIHTHAPRLYGRSTFLAQFDRMHDALADVLGISEDDRGECDVLERAVQAIADGLIAREELKQLVGDRSGWLVWSPKHTQRGVACWWRPKSAGYTEIVAQAGRYSEAEARDIERGGGGERVAVSPEMLAMLRLRVIADFDDPALPGIRNAALFREWKTAAIERDEKEERERDRSFVQSILDSKANDDAKE